VDDADAIGHLRGHCDEISGGFHVPGEMSEQLERCERERGRAVHDWRTGVVPPSAFPAGAFAVEGCERLSRDAPDEDQLYTP
jgi:hypothetical protein